MRAVAFQKPFAEPRSRDVVQASAKLLIPMPQVYDSTKKISVVVKAP